jgi:hypothetical protein
MLFLWRKNEERNEPRLESIIVTAKLRNFLGLFLKKERLFYLQIVFYDALFGRSQVGRTDKHFDIIYLDDLYFSFLRVFNSLASI